MSNRSDVPIGLWQILPHGELTYISLHTTDPTGKDKNMIQVNEGDVIKVTRVGTVKGVSRGSDYQAVTFQQKGVPPIGIKGTDTVEIIRKAEPEYVQGAYYMADDGVIYQRVSDRDLNGWFKWGGELVNLNCPKRPLRRMIPQDQGSTRGNDGF